MIRRWLQNALAYPSSLLAIACWMAAGAGLLVAVVYAESVARVWWELATRPRPLPVQPMVPFCRFKRAPTKQAGSFQA